MANAQGVRAGAAFIEITGEDKNLQAALNRAAQRIQALGATIRNVGVGLSAIGAAITAPLMAAAKSAAESGAALYDMSKRTGFSADNLSTLGFAAKMAGTDMETFEGAVKRMQKSIAGVEDQAEGTTGSLTHLGISTADIKDLRADEQFRMVADAIADIEDPAQRSAAAMKVFGRAGTALLPMFARLRDFEGAARQFGFVKSDEGARQAKQFAVALQLVDMASSSVWKTLGSAVMPTLARAAQVMFGATLAVRDFVRQHKDGVATVFKFGAVLGGVGASLVGVSLGITAVGRALSVVSGAFSVAKLAGAGLMAMVNTVAVGGIGLAIGAIGVAAVGLGGYLLFATESGRKALGSLAQYFVGLKDVATIAFGGIADALSAGDWKLAAEVAWAGLKLAWVQGIAPLKAMWIDLMSVMKTMWAQMGAGLAAGWFRAIAKVKDSLESFLATYQTIMAKAGGFWAKEEEERRHNAEHGRLLGLYSTHEMSKEDYDRESAKEDAHHNRQLGAVDASTSEQSAKFDAEMKKAQDANDADLKQKLANIDQTKAADLQRIEDTRAAEMQEAKDDLDDKKAKLDELRKKAKADRDADPLGLGGLLNGFSAGPDAPGNGDLAAATQAAQYKALGTFNPNAAGRIGGGDFSLAGLAKESRDELKKQTVHQKKTADNTKKIADLGPTAFK